MTRLRTTVRKADLIDLLHRSTNFGKIFAVLNKPDFWSIEACVVPIQDLRDKAM